MRLYLVLFIGDDLYEILPGHCANRITGLYSFHWADSRSEAALMAKRFEANLCPEGHSLEFIEKWKND